MHAAESIDTQSLKVDQIQRQFKSVLQRLTFVWEVGRMDSTPFDDEFSQSWHLESAFGPAFFDPADESDAPALREVPVPFVWQHGRRLLLLDEEPIGWVLAELSFEPDTCRYAEIRRAVYEWEREAVGSIMSRALASGEHALVDAARSLNNWLLDNYGHSIHEAPPRSRCRFPISMS